MGQCWQFAYDMIEFVDSLDIKDAKLFSAIINTIDRGNNSADITISEDCPLLSGKDLTAVEFFYHCQDSDGSAEDLARSHAAFYTNDEVYVLLVPENGQASERFYIIGHVDIRTTRRCLSGPIAVGCWMKQTTTALEVITDNATSQELSSQTTITVEEVGLTVEPGTTTTTGTVDNGNGTSTTTTTTVVVARDIWERRLTGCIEVETPWMIYPPKHLLNARYLAADSEPVALVVLQDDIDGNWQVLVERPSGETLDLRYTISMDDLHVSAALSDDLGTLYVVESRCPYDSTTATWYRYAWNSLDGEWSLSATGSVIAPPGVTAKSTRHFSVDRQGKLTGYWLAEFDVRTEAYHPPGGWCPNGDIYGIPVTDYSRSWLDYTHFWGGYWDLAGDGAYQYGSYRHSANVLVSGDFAPVREQLREAGSVLVSESEYTWSNDLLSTEWYAGYARSEMAMVHQDTGWSATVGGVLLDGGLYDEGLSYQFSADSSSETRISFPDPNAAGWQTTVFTINFNEYQYRSGSRRLQVTAGGWIDVVDSATVRTPNSMSSVGFEGTSQLPTVIVEWGYPACPIFLDELTAAHGLTESSRTLRQLVHPEAIAIGETTAILRSFSSVDQQSGDTAYGIMTQDGADAAAWRVWRNGVLRTDQVETCCEHPIHQLNAIYWRAQ